MPTLTSGVATTEVQRRILDAARLLLIDEGARNVKSADIAKKSGVSQTTMFRYYGDVSTILAAVYDEAWGQINDYLMRESFVRPAAGGPEDALVSEFVLLSELRNVPSLRDAATVAFVYFRRPKVLGSNNDSENQRRFENRIQVLCQYLIDAHPHTEVTAAGLRTVLVNFAASMWFTWLFVPQENIDLDLNDMRLGITSLIHSLVFQHENDRV